MIDPVPAQDTSAGLSCRFQLTGVWSLPAWSDGSLRECESELFPKKHSHFLLDIGVPTIARYLVGSSQVAS